ncbi:helix-turn-helix domain-containing protein [Larkinella terrae]|uniref:Helix-turn-helix domain-containing protein n=1 Tax=Larkinella terrae TaxID=2025311 RepID=A0A7K0EM47_9BACT|nr:helix-turn-helix domain-containing protein [Larkinella terrae]MRS62556.1 helix-turn-helix domain-containing protein [Larkinella terrae]
MSIVSNNIKYLRRLNGLTQEQFARRIGIKRSLLGAYEEARANPNLDNLMSIARAFNTNVDNLLKSDLRKIRETPDLALPLERSSSGERPVNQTGFPASPLPKDLSEKENPATAPKALSTVLEKYYQQPAAPAPVNFQKPADRQPPIKLVSQRIVLRPVSQQDGFFPFQLPHNQPQSQTLSFNNVYENSRTGAHPVVERRSTHEIFTTNVIHWVRKRQFSDYLQSYQQTDFLSRLPVLQLPLLPPDNYRAFEADEEYTFPGAVLIGKFIRNWFDIADGNLHIIVIQNQGILCRRIFNQVKLKGTLLLTSDQPSISRREVSLRDVLEVWEISAFISQKMPEPAPSLDGIRSLVDDLRYELDRIQKNNK